MRSMWTLLLTVLSAVAAASAETCPRPLTNAECIEHSRTAANDAPCSNTYYSCVGGEWTRTPVQCASGLVFNSTLGDCENSENRLCNNYCEYQLCLEDPDVGRSCEESGATQPYGGDCNRYWECSVEAGDDQTPVGSPATPQWNIQTCPMGYLYDALEGECVKVSVGGMVKCMDACRLTSVQGPTAHISDLRVECFDLFEQCVPDTKRATPVTCNEYYQCSSGGGWVKRTCNAGESFDSDTNQCVNNALGAKCLTSCECVLPSTCDTASDVARKDPYNCTKYYRCVSNGWTSHHTCPDGQQFNLNYQDAQDYCVSGNVNCEICPYNVSNFQYTTRLPHVVTTRQTTTPRFSVTTPTPLTDPPATSAPSVDDSATTLSPAGAVSALCYLPSTCVRDETPDYPVIGDCGARWHCSVRNNSWNKLNCTSGRQFDINTRDCRPMSEAQCANCDGVTTPDDVVHLQTTETSGNDETTVEPEDPEDSTAQTTVAPKARQTSVPDELASTAAPTAPRTSASLTPEPSTHAPTTPEQSTHAPSTVQASTRVTARVEDSTPEDTTIAQGFVQTTAAEDQTSEPSLVPSTEDLLQPDATTAPAEVSSSGASTPADAAAEISSSSADRPSTESGIIYTTPEPTTDVDEISSDSSIQTTEELTTPFIQNSDGSTMNPSSFETTQETTFYTTSDDINEVYKTTNQQVTSLDAHDTTHELSTEAPTAEATTAPQSVILSTIQNLERQTTIQTTVTEEPSVDTTVGGHDIGSSEQGVDPTTSVLSTEEPIFASTEQNVDLSSPVGTGTTRNTEISTSASNIDLESSRSDEISSGVTTSAELSSATTGLYTNTNTAQDMAATTSQTQTVGFTDKLLVYCPRTLDGEYTWPRTLAGTHATLTCDTSGVRTRGCSLGGIWGKVDMSGCVSPELYAVVNTINDAMNATEMREKTQSLRAITDATTSGDDRQQPLSVANMNATLVALYDLTDLTVTNRESRDIDVKEQIEDLAGITSDLLDPQNENTWAAMLEEEPDCGERVLQSVEDFTSVLAEYVPQGGSTNITEENIAIQVVSVDADTQNKALVLPYPVKPAPENSRGEGQGQESGEDDGEGQENWLGGMDKVELEVETIVKLKRDLKTSHIIMWTAIYRNMSFLRTPVNGTELNSKIVAFTIEKVTPDYIFDPMVRMAFMPMQPLGDLEPKCSFWDFQENSLGNWSQSGCYLIHKDDGNITCECNHLTNFAVLMAPSQKQFDKAHEVALEIISVVGCIISVVALFITIVLHTLAWSRIKSHHGAVLLNLCAVLIVANVLFLVGIDRVENETFCTVIAVALHYFFLVAFMSMLADGIMFLLYICFVLMRKTRRHTALLILMAWVVPAIIVGASYGITKGDGFGTDEMCWLALDKGLLAAFVGPVLIVILINFTILLVVLITLCNSTSAKQKTNFQKLKSTIWNIVVIMPLLGITWVFGVLAVKNAALAFTYLFCITNSLQGALIGFFHCVLNKKLREALSDRMSSSFDSSSFPQSKASRKKAVNKLAMQNKMEREVRRQQSRNSDSTISTTPRV